MESLNSVLVFVTICPLIVLSSGGQSFSYKTDCSKQTDCELNRYLECSSRLKICECPIHTQWDPHEQVCMTKEGQQCGNGIPGPKCIINSSCLYGRCQCHDGYLRNGFGACDLGYNVSCDETVEGQSQSRNTCAWRFMLECSKSEKKCKCRGEGIDFIWDEIRQKCVSLVGSVCDLDKESSDDRFECVDNAHCVNGRCECLPGHNFTPKRTCLLKYGEKCDNLEGKKCDRYNFLNCQDGKCGCEFYGQMLYDERMEKCLMLAGEFCDLTDDKDANYTAETDFLEVEKMHRCIRDAVCLPGHHHSSNNKGKCVCSTGKFKSANGTCTNKQSHGFSCSFAGDCNQSDFLTCVIDEVNGGLCSCIPNEMFYNGSECLVFPGRSCSRNSKCGRNSHCNNGEYCSCFDGYNLDPIRLDCYKVTTVPAQEVKDPVEAKIFEVPDGQNLQTLPPPPIVENTSNNDAANKGWISWNYCSELPTHSLMFKKCNCSRHPEFLIWSEEEQKCLGRVGSNCESDDSCTKHSFCDSEDRTCQCNPSARTTLDKTCVLRKSSVGHQPYQGHPNYIDDGNEISRLYPRPVSATSTGYKPLQHGFIYQCLIVYYIGTLYYFVKI